MIVSEPNELLASCMAARSVQPVLPLKPARQIPSPRFESGRSRVSLTRIGMPAAAAESGSSAGTAASARASARPANRSRAPAACTA